MMKKAIIVFGISFLFGRLLFAQVAVEGQLVSFDQKLVKLKQKNGGLVIVPKSSIPEIKRAKTGDKLTATLSAEALIDNNPGLKAEEPKPTKLPAKRFPANFRY